MAEVVEKRKVRLATTSLAGCFGCHMSFLDIDERLFKLIEHVEFDRSPLTDIKHCGPCDIGLIEGGVCNAENVHVLREFRNNCKLLIALVACASCGSMAYWKTAWCLALRKILLTNEISYLFSESHTDVYFSVCGFGCIGSGAGKSAWSGGVGPTLGFDCSG